MEFQEKKSVPNPRAKANPLSIVFFWWIFPLFRRSAKKELDVDDLYDVLKEDRSGKIGDELQKAWDLECQKADKKKKKPSFLSALLKVYWKRYAVLGFTMMLDEWVIRVSQTWMLYKLIQAFGSATSSEDLKTEKYLYGTGICLTTFLHTVVLHPTVFEMSHFGMKCRVSCCSVIYRKALKLSKAAQGQTTVGQLVNLLSNDVNRFDVNVMFLHYLYLGPVQACIFMYLLWDIGEFGISVLAGAGFIIILIPLQYWIGKLFTIYRFQIAQRTDKRGQIMNEIIIAMRVIKMYAWEKPFSALIAELRRLEVKILRKAAFLRAFYLSLFISSSKLITYLTILAFILQGKDLKADAVFFMVSIYTVMRQIMISFIPSAAAHIGELMVSINRIQEFLLLDENKSTDTLKIYKSLGVQEGGEEGTSVMAASVVMNDVTARWTSDKVTLESFNLNLRGDRLVMVVGPVGSGKTSFLHSLISELPIESGTCVINGSTSYASQEPWIFTGNLRQNVLFGQNYNDDRYRDVIRVSALEEDLRQLPFGENTIVGERGVALSGGQKARVNLARALYHKADIYLLDDPLSAVDARVSRHIFEKCVKQHLKGHLRILVTHQLQYLPQADHVIVLNNGRIQAQGTYTELVEQGIDFVSLMASETEEDSKRKDSLLPEAALGLARMGSRRKSRPIVEEKVLEVEVENKEKPVAVAETMAGGSVTARTYWDYFAAGGSYVAIFFLLVGFIISQALVTAADVWLSKWTTDTANFNEDCKETPTLPDCKDGYDDSFNLWVYTGIIVALFFVTNIRSIYFFQYCMTISINVHNRMFGSMVRAPIKFFDDNPSGRIMNRFTKDIGAMDELLPTTFYDAFSIFLLMVGIMVNILISNYYIGIPAIILMVALVFIRRFFIRTARHVKRVEAVTRSPVFTHLAATLQGLTTIRALGAEKALADQFDGHQDIHSSAWYTYIAANRWFGIWLEMASLVFLCLVTYSFMVLGGVLNFSDSQIGLAISSTLGLLGTFQWGMRQSAETENLMTSVERALEYVKLDSEAPLDSKPDKKPPSDWPEYGEVRFDNMSLAYDEKDVLKELSFTIKGREKIGIVGRTGAGKSSIIAGVFRMTEPRGKVYIDKINIGEIGLHDLRKNISIIPQDPVLFSGTVRYNMDPFDKYDDNLIWSVLEEIGLKEDIPALDFEVSDGGSNFSVGQRQLVCLGRAILRRNKIIVMDEATANVDPETDGFIQTTIRQKFHDCTIITIAHRLHSVMDCDKILVLDNGYLREYDHPHLLLQNPSGILTSMVSHTGKASAEILKRVAKETFIGRRGSFQVDNVSVLSFARRQSIISDIILSDSTDSDSDNPDGGEPEMHPVEKHFRDAGLFLDDEDSGSDSQEAQQSEVPEDE